MHLSYGVMSGTPGRDEPATSRFGGACSSPELQGHGLNQQRERGRDALIAYQRRSPMDGGGSEDRTQNTAPLRVRTK